MFLLKHVVMQLFVLIMVSIQAISIEASPLYLKESIDRAKHATVGILQHETDSSHQTVQSQFAIRGSGVHVGEGYILTARHVVERQKGGKTEIPKTIQVITGTMMEFSADFIGINGFHDVVLYRIELREGERELPFVMFEDTEPRSGDEVFTVGYPLGWGPALAFGRLGNPRTFLPTAQTRLMQVDLSACSGNSGGGLFNEHGKIVGMLHAIIQSESHERERRCSRFAFAVPGVVVQKIVKALKSGISPTFPKLGIRMTVVKVDNQWRVAVAKAKGPARRAGVRKGDILLSINDQRITSASQLKSYLLEQTRPGESIELRVFRDQTEKMLTVTLGEA